MVPSVPGQPTRWQLDFYQPLAFESHAQFPPPAAAEDVRVQGWASKSSLENRCSDRATRAVADAHRAHGGERMSHAFEDTAADFRADFDEGVFHADRGRRAGARTRRVTSSPKTGPEVLAVKKSVPGA